LVARLRFRPWFLAGGTTVGWFGAKTSAGLGAGTAGQGALGPLAPTLGIVTIHRTFEDIAGTILRKDRAGNTTVGWVRVAGYSTSTGLRVEHAASGTAGAPITPRRNQTVNGAVVSFTVEGIG
jgi:hypothetical protein